MQRLFSTCGGIASVLRGYLGYRGHFFSDFYKSEFLIFTYSEIRKLGLQKSEIFKHLFDIHQQSNTKLKLKNPRF